MLKPEGLEFKPNGPKKLMHLVIGTPDGDNCPICRAHGLGKGDQASEGTPGPILIEELPLTDILRCSCPMCETLRQEPLED